VTNIILLYLLILLNYKSYKMTEQEINTFLLTTQGCFPADQVSTIKNQLLQSSITAGDLAVIPFKKPVIALVLDLFAGGLGADEFYIGNMSKGIVKFITCGGLGIWSIINLFTIMGATRQKNIQALNQILNK
jgi:TM2 domain-containing membrane protein YozV